MVWCVDPSLSLLTSCPAGKYTWTTGSTACSSCFDGLLLRRLGPKASGVCRGILLRRGRLYSCTVGRFIADSAASSCSSCATGTYRARPRHPPRVSLAPQVFRVLRRETLFYSSSSSSFFNWVHLYEFSNELKKKIEREEKKRKRKRKKTHRKTLPPLSLSSSLVVCLYQGKRDHWSQLV